MSDSHIDSLNKRTSERKNERANRGHSSENENYEQAIRSCEQRLSSLEGEPLMRASSEPKIFWCWRPSTLFFRLHLPLRPIINSLYWPFGTETRKPPANECDVHGNWTARRHFKQSLSTRAACCNHCKRSSLPDTPNTTRPVTGNSYTNMANHVICRNRTRTSNY